MKPFYIKSAFYLLLVLLGWPSSPSMSAMTVQTEESLIPNAQSSKVELVCLRLNSYIDDISSLLHGIDLADEHQLNSIGQEITRLNAKYQMYCQSCQSLIAENDSLLNLVATFEQFRQLTTDSIAFQRNYLLQLHQFEQTEKLLLVQSNKYTHLSRQAVAYSQVAASAPQLAALKAKEQLMFAEISSRFAIAQSAAATIHNLQSRMMLMEQQYISLKSQSEKIQSAEYKPLISRIKDYLLGLAAVGIIMLAVNMVVTKIQAFKQMRANLKKTQEMIRKANTQYPQI